MKNLFTCLILAISFLGFSQDRVNKISGIVTYGLTALEGVSIAVEDSTNGTSTGADGKYAILASPKDVLVFTYVGLQTIKIIVEDVTTVLNVEMFPNVEELEGVTVTKRLRKTQKDLAIAYRTEPNIIKTGYGYIHGQYSAYHMKTFDGSQLNPAAITILDAIMGKFPSVVIDRGFGGGKPLVYIRRKGRVIFELDGMVFTEVPMWVDVASIERIALIYGTVAGRKWGNGAAGILIINTNHVQNAAVEPGTNKPYDLAKLRNNLYANDALDKETVLENEPNYVKELYQSTDADGAFKVYEKYKPNFGTSYFFVLDVYRSLQERFEDDALANTVLEKHMVLFKENPNALKALAYTYQSHGRLKKAQGLYKELFILRPNYVQSYLDLANSYRENGGYKKAAQLFHRYEYLVAQDYFAVSDSMMVSQIMSREFSNLLHLKGNKILSNYDSAQRIADDDFKGTRLVFEWNDGEAEFELQFVNPEGRYFKTEHSFFADAERIREEKLLGYTTAEFLIDGSMPATWQVNAKYLGNKKLTPSYLKASTYYDYGTDAQRKEIKVFKLGLKNVNQELFKVNNTPSITSY